MIRESLRLRILIVGVIFLISPSLVSAQPSNDDCSSAEVLDIDHQSNAPSVFSVDLTGATFSADENCEQPGVWFKFLALSDFYQIMTNSNDANCDDEDAEIEVFTGPNCGALIPLMINGCQDTDNTLCNNNELFRSFVTPGSMIWVHVSRDDDDEDETFALEIDPSIVVPRSITVESCDPNLYNGTYTTSITVNGYECYDKDNDDGSIFFNDGRNQFRYSEVSCSETKGGKGKGEMGVDEFTIAVVSEFGSNILDASPEKNCIIIGNFEVPIPTLSQWGLIILGIFFVVLGVISIRNEIFNSVVSN